MGKISTVLHHYIGVALLIVVGYFFILSPILAHLDVDHKTGPVVVSVAPTPSTRTTRSVNDVVQAAKDQAVISALRGEVLQLSASMQTIAHAVERLGVNTKLANAATTGLTRQAPATEIVTVGTKTQVIPPKPALTDDQIEASLKKVLAETKVQTTSNVNVHWEPREPSPIFAAYSTDGSSGIGYTFKRTPAFNADALFTVSTDSMEVGAGLEHPIHGTAGGIGVNASVDTRTHQTRFGLFLAIHN